jgi:SOS response regulatory protein OraA/RecX
MSDNANERRPGRSIGQKRRHALEVLAARQRFLSQLVTKRKLNGQPTDREADEASVIEFVIDELTRSWSTAGESG